MVNVSRGKNEYGHHLLDLSLRSVRVCVCAHLCVQESCRHTHTHTMCSWRGISKYGMEEKGGRKKERRKQLTEERRVTKNLHKTGEVDNERDRKRETEMIFM